MNEIIHKNVKRFLAGIGALVLCFSYTLPVFAFGNNWMNTPYYKSVGYIQGNKAVNSNSSGNRFVAINVKDSNGNAPEVNKVGVLFYTSATSINSSMSSLFILFYSYDSCYIRELLYSNNNITFNANGSSALSQTYTATGTQSQATTVYYNVLGNLASNWAVTWNPSTIKNVNEVFPNIPIILGVSNINDILAVISSDSNYLPWNGTTSDGGRHWSDGTTLSGENTTLYNNVYTVMNNNSDNSVTEEEVNYYNYTYNTNYDYDAINGGNTFTLDQFLYYVAVMLTNGDNPAGDGSPSVPDGGSGSGIVIGDGSFTQTQSQSIEQNAVNVTVTNNNELTNENLNHINQIINNNPETTDNTFQDAIGNMNQFRAMAAAFAALAGVVLGWLPSWVTGLIGLSFSILSIMIIFRLIHLFV